jgi:hypothetical protein
LASSARSSLQAPQDSRRLRKYPEQIQTKNLNKPDIKIKTLNETSKLIYKRLLFVADGDSGGLVV